MVGIGATVAASTRVDAAAAAGTEVRDIDARRSGCVMGGPGARRGGRGARRSVGVDTRGGAILRNLKRLLVLHDAVNDADDNTWGEKCGVVAGVVIAWRARARGTPSASRTRRRDKHYRVLLERQVLARPSHYRSDVTSPRSTSMIDRTT
jgi:hypothetical protein